MSGVFTNYFAFVSVPQTADSIWSCWRTYKKHNVKYKKHNVKYKKHNVKYKKHNVKYKKHNVKYKKHNVKILNETFCTLIISAMILDITHNNKRNKK